MFFFLYYASNKSKIIQEIWHVREWSGTFPVFLLALPGRIFDARVAFLSFLKKKKAPIKYYIIPTYGNYALPIDTFVREK